MSSWHRPIVNLDTTLRLYLYYEKKKQKEMRNKNCQCVPGPHIKYDRTKTMTAPGVEPGLSRPQRDVLTTRRCGRCISVQHDLHCSSNCELCCKRRENKYPSQEADNLCQEAVCYHHTMCPWKLNTSLFDSIPYPSQPLVRRSCSRLIFKEFLLNCTRYDLGFIMNAVI